MTHIVNPNTPGSMQAAILYGIHDMRVESRPVPKPGKGEVLLKIASVGICGSDVHYYNEGRIGNQIVKEPTIMGHEFSAYIVQSQGGVNEAQEGSLVAVDPAIPCGKCEQCQKGHPNLCPHVKFCGTPPIAGVFSEYASMPAINCFALPEGFSPEEAAMLEPLGVALHSVNLAHLKPGESVAVLGAGPIGLLIGAVARLAGASAVYITEPLAYRREFARHFCANAVFDPGGHSPVGDILSMTEGRGVDVVFEAAGADETPEQAAELVRPGGRLILTGIPKDDRLSFNASNVRQKGLTIRLVRRMAHTYPTSIRFVSKHLIDVKSLITHRLPL
ncbi:MAG: alcohol dehydrogenase catalytic domain-containing protein, partial [Anaerolineaceae bacterium]|nr:alcohol dehydrogenase catalytic domain-containing protein [Anaerolineaceae bacterium]